MSCPRCGASLSVREYAWTHTHPTKWGRRVGTAMMVAGAIAAGIGALEVTGIAR